MSNIDFSKAPVGATHYSSAGCWYREVDGVVYFSLYDEGTALERSKDYSDIAKLKEIAALQQLTSIEDAQPATAKQPAPNGSGNPILGMVLADLTNRALEGKEKYGEPLKAHNGRNALCDAYQEALDLAMYLRQAIEEQSK